MGSVLRFDAVYAAYSPYVHGQSRRLGVHAPETLRDHCDYMRRRIDAEERRVATCALGRAHMHDNSESTLIGEPPWLPT
jgi:hypothetical protein